MICGEDNGAGTTFLGDVWVPSVAHFKIPLEGNPTRPDRPGDMYDAETVGAEKDSGPVTAVAINGIGIQVSFFLVKVLFLLEACFDLILGYLLSMKIQIMGGKITENLGFKSPLGRSRFFCSFFSFSNSSQKS